MKRFLILLLIVSCSPTKKFLETKEKWEKSVEDLNKLNLEITQSEDAILFIGSSSIRLWNTIEQDIEPYSSIRRGYGGAKYTDLIHFTERLVEPHNVRAVGIFVANDITGGDKDLKPKEVLNLVKYVIKSIQKTHKNKPIFIIETTPTPKRWRVWDKISQANDLISNFCSNKENLFFINTRNYFISPDGNPKDDYFRKDKLHLNKAGYSLWGNIIKESLNQILTN